MNKKNYCNPEQLVVKIPYQNALLAGSDPEHEPSEEGGGKTARQASFSTFDEE